VAQAVFSAACEGDSPIFAAGAVDPLGIVPCVPRKLGQSPVNGYDEGLTRNVPAFSRFFEAMGYSHGELTNYANIARDCGADAKTVKEYYRILCDTLLGRLVLPCKRRHERQVIGKAPKSRRVKL